MAHITDITFVLGAIGNLVVLFLAFRGKFYLLSVVCGWRTLIDSFLLLLKCERWFGWTVDAARIEMISPFVQWGELISTPIFYFAIAMLIVRARAVELNR